MINDAKIQKLIKKYVTILYIIVVTRTFNVKEMKRVSYKQNAIKQDILDVIKMLLLRTQLSK